jgi:hypothetical protein
MNVWVVVQIGCIECGGQDRSRLIGVYTDEAVAQQAREATADQIDSSDTDVLLFAGRVDAGEGRLIQEGVWSRY